jgi:hypothetical protein
MVSKSGLILMKKLVAVLAVLAVVNVSSKTFAADGPVNLTNYDSNNPIFYQPAVGARVNLPVAGSFVQVLGGPSAGALQVLSSTGPGNPNVFTPTEPGFFDGGFGFVPGVAESAQGTFQIRAWRSGATFATAAEQGTSAIFQNAVGRAPVGDPPPAPSPAALVNAPSFTVGIPEPSTMILGLLGATVLLLRRKK